MKIHVVQHTHWDREWYFTSQESKVLLFHHLDEIINELENNMELNSFTLDGQTSILEEYLSMCPENYNRIKNLVEKGKLKIGPWYSQTDTLIVSGESIVRNLEYGIRFSKRLGHVMDIGYLPDSFGHGAQIPMILKKCGINNAIIWRGVSDRHIEKSQFYWKSDNGDRVFVVHLPEGYPCANRLPINNDEELKKKIVDTMVPILKRKTVSKELLLPNGSDQLPIQNNIVEVLKKLNEMDEENQYCLSSFEDYIKSVIENTEYKEVLGEFTHSKIARIHKSIYSTRYDIKKLITMLEYRITNITEPILVMCDTLGIKYPKAIMEEAWKMLLASQAHDSIGCCCSDKTNNSIYNRLVQAKEIISSVENMYFKLLSDKISFNEDKGNPIIVINTLPYERRGTIKLEVLTKTKNFRIVDNLKKEVPFIIESTKIVEGRPKTIHHEDGTKEVLEPDRDYINIILIKSNDIPSMGYCTYRLIETGDIDKVNDVKKYNYFIENEIYSIVYKGSYFEVIEKETGKVSKLDFYIEDCADEGDEFNFSKPIYDKEYKINIEDFDVSCYENKVNSYFILKGNIILPEDLSERKEGRRTKLIDVNIKLSLNPYENNINVCVSIDNKVKDHRMRFVLKTHIKTEESFSDCAYGIVKRPTNLDDIKWKEEKWTEKPIAVDPMLRYVLLKDDLNYSAIVTKGIKEFEIKGLTNENKEIAITLFRGVGYLGKSDLQYRPGRSSGFKFETPTSQMLGTQTFEFNILLGDKISNNEIEKKAKELFSEIVGYQYLPSSSSQAVISPFKFFHFNSSKRIFDDKFSLMRIEGEGLLTCLYKNLDNKVIARIYNGNSNNINCEINSDMHFTLKHNNFIGEEDIIIDNNKITIGASDCECIELDFELDSQDI